MNRGTTVRSSKMYFTSLTQPNLILRMLRLQMHASSIRCTFSSCRQLDSSRAALHEHKQTIDIYPYMKPFRISTLRSLVDPTSRLHREEEALISTSLPGKARYFSMLMPSWWRRHQDGINMLTFDRRGHQLEHRSRYRNQQSSFFTETYSSRRILGRRRRVLR